MGIFMRFRKKLLLAVFKFRRLVNRWLGARQLDYQPYRLSIFTDTIREYETRARSVRKEPKTVSWIEEFGGPGSVLYDIGANVGAYTLIAASRGTTVAAFEPAYQNAYKLHKNISLNKLSERVTVIPLAISDKEKVVRILQKDDTFGASNSFSATSDGNLYGRSFLATRLDACVKTFALPLPTMIKIDVDGAEVEVLRGASELIENVNLKSILIETEEANTSLVKKMLTEANFRLTDEERMDEHTVNYIFARI